VCVPRDDSSCVELADNQYDTPFGTATGTSEEEGKDDPQRSSSTVQCSSGSPQVRPGSFASLSRPLLILVPSVIVNIMICQG